MNKIFFSHNYKKLQHPIADSPTETIAQAILLDVTVNDFDELPQVFLDWDTQNGLYKLKEIRYILLLFAKDECNLFTTLRRYTLKKYDYYYKKIGETFVIEIMSKTQRRGA